MTLRAKTLSLIAITLLLLIVVIYVIARVIVMSSFITLESEEAVQHLQRTTNLIQSELADFTAAAGDWSNWDDSYTFAQTAAPEYVEDNLMDDTFYNLRWNLAMVMNTAGETVYTRSMDLETGDELPVPEVLTPLLTLDSGLMTAVAVGETQSGLVMADTTPLMLVVSPILSSAGEGPIGGYFVLARYLDQTWVRQLADSTGLALEVLPIGGMVSAGEKLYQDAVYDVTAMNDRELVGQAVVNDYSGQPGFILQAQLPRAISEHGWATISYFMIALLFGGLIVGGAMIVFLERLVLSRVAHLSDDVSAIRTSANVHSRVRLEGSDELSRLSTEINGMLDSIAESEVAVRKSERQLQTLVNNAPITLWAMDFNGRILLIKGRGLEALGISEDNAYISGEYSHDIGLLVENSRRALKGETTAAIVQSGEKVLDTRCNPLHDEQGSIIGVIGVATDITERRQAEAALGSALVNLDAQQKNLERVREFFRATLEQMSSTIKLGASRGELLVYLDEIQHQFNRIQQQS